MRALLVHNLTAGGGGRAAGRRGGERLAAGGIEAERHETRSRVRQAGCLRGRRVLRRGRGHGRRRPGRRSRRRPGRHAGRARGAGGGAGGGGNDAARSLGRPRTTPWPRPACWPGCGGGRPTWPRWPAGLPERRRGRVRLGGQLTPTSASAAGNRPRYVGAVLAELAVGRVAAFELVLDGRPMPLRGWAVAVANGPSYGGGMRVAPQASLDDGLLEVVVIHEIGKPGALRPSPRCSRAAMSSTWRWLSTALPGRPGRRPHPGRLRRRRTRRTCRPPSRSARRPSLSWPPTPPPGSRLALALHPCRRRTGTPQARLLRGSSSALCADGGGPGCAVPVLPRCSCWSLPAPPWRPRVMAAAPPAPAACDLVQTLPEFAGWSQRLRRSSASRSASATSPWPSPTPTSRRWRRPAPGVVAGTAAVSCGRPCATRSSAGPATSPPAGWPASGTRPPKPR